MKQQTSTWFPDISSPSNWLNTFLLLLTVVESIKGIRAMQVIITIILRLNLVSFLPISFRVSTFDFIIVLDILIKLQF